MYPPAVPIVPTPPLCPFVRLSVPSVDRAATGLLLWARRGGDIDRSRHQHVVEQQMRAASRRQLA